MAELDNKERIREQATALFMKYGVRSVSMDDIANELGMSKKTIYQFYSDKDELVDAVMLQEIQYSETCCEADRNQSENAIHEQFMAMDMVVEMFRSMNPSLLHDIQKYHPNTWIKFLRYKNDYLYNVIRQNLVRGIKEDLYREDINIEIISRFRVEFMLLAFNPEFQAKVKHSLVEIEEELILHFLFGLVNLKGYKMILKYQQERTKKTISNAKIK